MRFSWQLGKIAGIPLQFHWSFVLVFVWVIYTSWSPEGGIDTDALLSVGIWTVLVFMAVLLHEYGHAFVARWLGIGTKKIVIYPLGGGAYLEHMPEEPNKEILIAIGGPLINILLAVVVAPLIWLSANWKRKALLVYILRPESNVPVFGVGPLDYAIVLFFVLNLMLAFFNLLPAYPLDGGRIFRAALSWVLGRDRATIAAALLGVAFAAVFLGFAIYLSDWLFGVGALLVALFAIMEINALWRTRLLRRHVVSEVAAANFPRIYLQDGMYEAWDAYQQNERQGLIVLNSWQEVMGALGAEQFSQWQEDQAPADAVSFYYKNQWQAFGPANNLLEVARYLDGNSIGVVPVFENGRLTGIVTGQQLLQLIRRHSLLKWRRR